MARTKSTPLKKRKTVEEGVQRQVLDNLVGNGKTTRKAQLDGGTATDMNAVTGYEANTTGVISQQDQAGVVPPDEGIESQSLWKGTRNCRQRGDGEFDLSSGPSKARWDKLLASVNELGQETFGEITWLQSELKAARIAMQAEKSERDIKLAAMQKKLRSVEGDRAAIIELLAREISKAKIERDKNLVLENALKALRQRKYNVDCHLVVMWESVQDSKKSEEASKIQLEQAVKTIVELEDKLASRSFDKKRLDLCLETTLHLETNLQEVEDEKEKVVKENVTLAVELVSIREEKSELTSSLEMTRRQLEKVKDKTLCQICLESQKNVICLPCLHFRCCSPCLENHRKLNNTCPSCLTDISGVLSCEIDIKISVGLTSGFMHLAFFFIVSWLLPVERRRVVERERRKVIARNWQIHEEVREGMQGVCYVHIAIEFELSLQSIRSFITCGPAASSRFEQLLVTAAYVVIHFHDEFL